jgi:tRNA/rRNA methyltransferase
LHGCVRAIATTARVRDWGTPLETPRSALPWLLEEPDKASALIFGREDRGLSNEELNYAQRFVRIPTNEIYPSLNLATAVGICCYELAQHTEVAQPQTIHETELAPLELVEAYYQQLESLLLDVGYIYPHTAASRMEKFRQLYNRARLTTNEVAMLRGIFRQVEWALNNRNHDENL